jgi:hypothetical protein
MTSEWDRYKTRTLFHLFEAACLLQGHHPKKEYLDNPPDLVPDTFRELTEFMAGKGLIDTGLVNNRPPGDIESTRERSMTFNYGRSPILSPEDFHEKESRKKFHWGAQIRWREILEYADKKGICPAFLASDLTESVEIAPLSPHTEEKPLHPKERKSYLKLIAGLLKAQKIDPRERGNAKSLVGMVNLAGFELSDDKIRDILKEVKDLTD